ncbi:DUF2314 domain-containing protein [Pseudooceanicola sp.]|uniref:DUF2314 domain-containing protein n=1 Tax=Pseudooceanicola sp. TaxID=1914328 RepID=UPI0026175E35|nr:DUF2314 domain-containing protein [Pseudooceanicola sp.]MDF1854013.1 DUF2314 domain-containing protein [Pseudooceanicola sp.]
MTRPNLRLLTTLALVVSPLLAVFPVIAQADSVQYRQPSVADLVTPVQAAQATLPKFLAHAIDRSGEGIRGTRLLIQLGEAPTTELIWVSPFFLLPEGGFAGHIAGLPVVLTGYIIGQKLPFEEAQIMDWAIYLDDGKIYGDYLLRAQLDQMTPEDAARHSGTLSADPVPAAWK